MGETNTEILAIGPDRFRRYSRRSVPFLATFALGTVLLVLSDGWSAILLVGGGLTGLGALAMLAWWFQTRLSLEGRDLSWKPVAIVGSIVGGAGILLITAHHARRGAIVWAILLGLLGLSVVGEGIGLAIWSNRQ